MRRPWRSFWIATRRVASNRMPKHWKTKPEKTKRSSPYDARATPAEMPMTVTALRLSHVSRPIMTDMPRTATEVKALSLRA